MTSKALTGVARVGHPFHPEGLRRKLAIALPDLENPLSRHELESVFQGIGRIARLSDPCLQHELILPDRLGGRGRSQSRRRKDDNLPELDRRSMGPAHDLITKAEGCADLSGNGPQRCRMPHVRRAQPC